jgi:hypothetical protein
VHLLDQGEACDADSERTFHRSPGGTPLIDDIVREGARRIAFTVTDDHPALPEPGTPAGGYFNSLLARDRWLHAAIAAVSTRTVVESWDHDRALRQQLDGTKPTAPARLVPVLPGAGTRIAFHLDLAYAGPDAAITTELTALIPPDLADTEVDDNRGTAIIRDHGSPGPPAELRLL